MFLLEAATTAQSTEIFGVLDFNLEQFFRLSGPVSAAFAEPFFVIPSVSFSPPLDGAALVESTRTGFSVRGPFPLFSHPLNTALWPVVGPTGPVPPEGPDSAFWPRVSDQAFTLLDGNPAFAYVYRRHDEPPSYPKLRLARCQGADGLGEWQIETIVPDGKHWVFSEVDLENGSTIPGGKWFLENLPEGAEENFSELNLVALGERLVISYVDTITGPLVPEGSPTETLVRILVREESAGRAEWKPLASLTPESFPGHTIADWPPAPIGAINGKIALALAGEGEGVNAGDALYLAAFGGDWGNPGPAEKWELTKIASRSDAIRGAGLASPEGRTVVVFYGLAFSSPDQLAPNATLYIAETADASGADNWKFSEIGKIGPVYGGGLQATVGEEAGRTVVSYQYLTYNAIGMLQPEYGVFLSDESDLASWARFENQTFGRWITFGARPAVVEKPHPGLGIGEITVPLGLFYLPTVHWRATADPQIQIKPYHGAIQITFTGVAGREYDFLRTSDLADPRWEVEFTSATGGNGTLTIFREADAAQAFFKIAPVPQETGGSTGGGSSSGDPDWQRF